MHDQNEMQSHREAMAGAMAFPGAPDDVAKILRQIGDSVAHNPGRLQRLAPRFDMGGREVGLSVVHPGGSSVAWRCPLLDVSPGGAAMLYPGFLHLHTRCMVHLAALGGKPLAISGRLAWCRFATGMVHVVGLAWDEELDVRQIVPQREWIEQVAKGDQHLNAELTGTMLAVGFDKLESGLLRIFTAGTRLRLRNVPDAGAALDLARAEAMDAILVDADNDSIDHADLSNRLRDMGLREPILLASSKPSAIAPQADGVEVVAKPLSRESLHVAIRDQMLANATPVAGSKPIHSDMPQLAEIGELAEAVSEYLALARHRRYAATGRQDRRRPRRSERLPIAAQHRGGLRLCRPGRRRGRRRHSPQRLGIRHRGRRRDPARRPRGGSACGPHRPGGRHRRLAAITLGRRRGPVPDARGLSGRRL